MPEVPALSRTGPVRAGARSLDDRVAHAFADDGPLASGLDGFEARPGQRRFAHAVSDVLQDGGTLVAEAGTGTGKTLAYLVPAVLEGKKVLISTGTRALQDQVFYKDLPLLARALGVEIRAAYMKGRTNYLCLHRFDRLKEAAAGLQATERSWLSQIGDWAEQTQTGDRSEIENLPDDATIWSELSATADQCLGRECPQVAECFVTKMRDRAADAQIVIVNHHLLCADASVRQGNFGEVIPECDAIVIDEAHQLEDVVTQYFGVGIGTHRIDEFVRDATQALGSLAADDARFAVEVRDHITDVQYAARQLFDHARLLLQRSGPGDRMTLTTAGADELTNVGDSLTAGLRAIISDLSGRKELPEDLKAVMVRASGIQDDLGVLLAAKNPSFVHFIEARGRSISLRAAPIDVSAIVRDAVLGERHATVLTSATLTVEQSFDYLTSRLGVSEATTLRLPSEFDFRSQSLLYLPPDMPDPRSPSFNRTAADTIEALLECSRGRAFVLFTSYAAMHEVHDLIESRVSWPLFVQGQAPRTALLRDFRATPNAVLLGTSSFWQGIDVAGEALSCVIIDRLPFASPSDPLVGARIAAIQARGGQPFNEYQVPLATLTLLQGLGRLIRSHSDRGVLAILDPRLTRMPYGRKFLSSFPPAPITKDIGAVERFFRRT